MSSSPTPTGTPIYVITMVPAAVPENKLTTKPSELILMIRDALMSHGAAKSELPVSFFSRGFLALVSSH